MQTNTPFQRRSSLTDFPQIHLYQQHLEPIPIKLGQVTLNQLIAKVCGRKKFKKVRLFDHRGLEIFEEDLKYLKKSIYATTNGLGLDAKSALFEYSPLEVLCQGGQAKVLLVQHKCTQVQRILKFSKPEHYVYLAREAIILNHLKHRNIVKQFGHKLFAESLEVVLELEYLQGGSLLDYILDHGPLSENIARQVFAQLVDAVNYCHKNNVIHRDLKLENVMIVKDLEVKLIDFGLAYLSGIGGQQAMNVGTLLYAAPEVIFGELKTVNKSVDIWGLGVILYYIVFADYPFKGESEKEILTNITKGYYTIPQHASKELSLLLQGIFNIDYEQRITINDIKQNNWVQGKVSPQLSLHISDQLTTSKQTHENTIRKGDLTIKTLLSILKQKKPI